jgi:ABC-type lipoprotein release transport system permease subunit
MFSHWTNGNSRDPVMLAIVAAVLLIAAALASIVPARLATSIEPMEALRAE